MDEITVEIKGLEELEEALTAGSKRAAQQLLRAVEMKAAQVLVESAQENAPYQTGQLADDIHKQTVRSDDAVTVRVGPSQATFWGLIQEFGAPEANVPALHWLENSAKEVQDDVLAVYYEELTQALAAMKR